MITLINDVISIEKEADTILENAHREAKKIEQDIIDKLQQYEREKRLKTEELIDLFKKQAEEEFQKNLKGLEDEERASLNAIENIQEETINFYADSIISRLFEL